MRIPIELRTTLTEGLPSYLDSVVHFAYVLLRMLEKYSKNKSFMYVRKKRAKRQKEKEGWSPQLVKG